MIDYDALYNKWSESTISNACIVRVINQCNQKCKHCAFRSGPDCVGQMSVKMCERINAWVPRRVILNIMGGEFTVLENYPEMLVALARGRSNVRLVTNGFWAHKNVDKFFDAMKKIKASPCGLIDVAISTDSWHNGNGDLAVALLENNKADI